MKNVLKILGLLIVVLHMSSCTSNTEDLKYNPNEESGWVQFIKNSPATIGAFQGAPGSLDLDVNIQVPTTSSDLTVFYNMTSVSGADPTLYFSNNGALVVPAGSTSHGGPDNGTAFDYNYLAEISFNLSDLNGVTLTEPMVFDVVLTRTSSSDITAGLAGVPEYPTSRRVVISPSLDGFVGTYTVQEQFVSGVNAPNSIANLTGQSFEVKLARLPGDLTASKFVITNTAGFNAYFVEGAELTFGAQGTLYFNDGNSQDGSPLVAGIDLLTLESSSYSYNPVVLQGAGPLGNFGPYQFILTKQ